MQQVHCTILWKKNIVYSFCIFKKLVACFVINCSKIDFSFITFKFIYVLSDQIVITQAKLITILILDPADYLGGSLLESSLSSSTSICVEYNIQVDNLVEGVESFEVNIDNLLPIGVPGLSLGQQMTTTIMIIDASQ